MNAPQKTLAQNMASLTDAMVQLIALIEAENEALAQHHPERIALSVDRKLILGRTVERLMEQIGPLKSATLQITEPERRRIVSLVQRFRAVGEINQTAIDAARRAAERVVTHIVDAVRKQIVPRQHLCPRFEVVI